MNFELSKDIEQWCQEALREVNGTPASPFEKVQAAIQVHQLKVLSDISRELAELSKEPGMAERKIGPVKVGLPARSVARSVR